MCKLLRVTPFNLHLHIFNGEGVKKIFFRLQTPPTPTFADIVEQIMDFFFFPWIFSNVFGQGIDLSANFMFLCRPN